MLADARTAHLVSGFGEAWGCGEHVVFVLVCGVEWGWVVDGGMVELST